MEAKIIRIGNSRGVRLPKVLLEQTGMTDKVNLTLDGGKIVIEPAERHPRQGWAESFRNGGSPELDQEDMDWLDAPLDTPLDDDELK
jgi:antitoxin MazE